MNNTEKRGKPSRECVSIFSLNALREKSHHMCQLHGFLSSPGLLEAGPRASIDCHLYEFPGGISRVTHVNYPVIWKSQFFDFFLSYLISCVWLIAVVKISSTILTRNRVCGQPCLVLDVSGIALSVSPFIVATHLLQSDFTMSRDVSYSLNWPIVFLFIYWDDHMVFVIQSLYMVDYVYWFSYIEPPQPF